MRLSDLEPGFVSSASGERLGVHFLCPRCRRQQLYIPTHDADARANWGVEGDLLNLTLTPSVDARHINGGHGTDEPRAECNWHGWVRAGEVTNA